MSAKLFMAVMSVLFEISLAIAAYYEGKRKGFDDGYESGFKIGVLIGEAKTAFGALIRSMYESGDAE